MRWVVCPCMQSERVMNGLVCYSFPPLVYFLDEVDATPPPFTPHVDPFFPRSLTR